MINLNSVTDSPRSPDRDSNDSDLCARAPPTKIVRRDEYPPLPPSPRAQKTIPMEDEDTYQLPRKVTKLSNFIQKSQTITQTSNRYDTLADVQGVENQVSRMNIPAPSSKSNKDSKIPPKPSLPPPIVIKGVVNSHASFINELKSTIKCNFFVKYTNNSTLLYISDPAEHRRYRNNLTADNEIEFYTYTTKEEKKHAFVIRGLPKNITEDELKEELADNNINAINIYQMKTKFAPLYLVIVNKDITVKYLNANVKHLMYAKVTWERRRNERLITQCRRCQAWGHATSNCRMTPACVKCAGAHLTQECTVPREQEAKCVNCGGPHTAANAQCPVYLRKIEGRRQIQQQQQQQQPRYVPAPPPTTNPWHQRQQQQQQRGAAPAPAPARNPAPAAAAAAAPPTGHGSGDFDRLMTEMAKLNSKINLGETIKAVSKLNELLAAVTTPMQVVEVLSHFTTQILPHYNILVASSSTA